MAKSSAAKKKDGLHLKIVGGDEGEKPREDEKREKVYPNFGFLPHSFDRIDQMYHGWLAKLTHGISPSSVSLAYADWLTHCAVAPGRQLEMAADAWEKCFGFSIYALRSQAGMEDVPFIEPLPQDRRFNDEAWQQFPFNIYYQGFLSVQEWWQDAIQHVAGVNKHHAEVVEFMNRQMLDAFSPSNFFWTNPVVLKETYESGGANLLQGAQYLNEDMQNIMSSRLPPHLMPYEVGKDMALTPGKVVYRNRLIELIQYEPKTKKVYAEPVLITPAWIMKYYILDLVPGKSLVEYLVDQGHTVFMISWKNPDSEDRDLGMEDYMRLGILEALDAIENIVPDTKIHAAGYCLGGTLLSMTAAYLAREGDERLKTVTMFAAQADFDDPGELALFVDESQIAFLKNAMAEQGYLDKFQMKGVFQWLRSVDLIWSQMIDNYLRGERNAINELMSWSSDATRMPYRMELEYLQKLFLNDDLSEGKYRIGGRVLALKDIRLPMFIVGTEKDHIAPWKSVYKTHLLTDADITFVLTNGGHNAGIVSELDHPRRRFRIHTTKAATSYRGPNAWLDIAEQKKGSWWPEWHQFLADASSKDKVAPPKTGNPAKGYKPLCDAPGEYVMQE